MRTKGMMLVEVVIAVTIFSLAFFPLLNFNQNIVATNNQLSTLENEKHNFLFLKKQLIGQKYNFLKNFIGTRNYEITNGQLIRDELLKDIFFPYNLTTCQITIEISPLTIYSETTNYDYLFLKVMYTIKNKTFSSTNFISSEGEIKNEV